jgi:1-acyl-sn-glycerol-3-phosphate acyltransferase
MKTIIKLILLAFAILSHIGMGSVFLFLSKFSPKLSKRLLNFSSRSHAKLALKIYGITIQIKPTPDIQHGGLFVANHHAELDAFILLSILPMRFVTSIDLGGKGLFGLITKIAGVILVERRNYSTLKRDIKNIAHYLKGGENVCVFPEATSTLGDMLPFRSSLYQSAINADAEIIPVTIKYVRVNGKETTLKDRQNIFYHREGRGFAYHLWKLCQQKSIDVEIVFHEPLKVSSRKLGCRTSRELIEKELGDVHKKGN